jgi:hypothetical protein
MTEHEENLRDLAAMFALTGLIVRNSSADNWSNNRLTESAFEMADSFMEARKPPPLEEGIAAIKKKRLVKKA